MRPHYSRGTAWINVASTAACQVRTDDSPPIVTRAQSAAVLVCSATAAVTSKAVLVPQPAHAAAKAPPAAAAEPPAAPASDAPATSAAEPPPGNHEFDLIIEELPNHRLYQPIPVQMQPFGNEMFSASVPALALSATGTSVSDALLLLKTQIEAGYAEIEKKSDLDAAEKEHLKFYYAHIVKEPPPPEFAAIRAPASSAGSKASRWAGRW